MLGALAFLAFLAAAGVVGTVIAIRDTLVDDPRPVPTRLRR